jgi:hypothetical protein
VGRRQSEQFDEFIRNPERTRHAAAQKGAGLPVAEARPVL